MRTLITNLTFETGNFPEKLAGVKPLHNKGSKSDMDNYRLIIALQRFSRKLYIKGLYCYA